MVILASDGCTFIIVVVVTIHWSVDNWPVRSQRQIKKKMPKKRLKLIGMEASNHELPVNYVSLF